MVVKVGLSKFSKFGIIGLGVLVLLAGIMAVVQCVREDSMIKEATKEDSSVPQGSEEFLKPPPTDIKTNSMLPSVFAPFFIAISCLLFAFLPIYYILFPIAVLCPIGIGLSIWSIIICIQHIKETTKMLELSAVIENFVVILLKYLVNVVKDKVGSSFQLPPQYSEEKLDLTPMLKLIRKINKQIEDLEAIYVINLVVLGISVILCGCIFQTSVILIFTGRPCSGGGNHGDAVKNSKKRSSKSPGTPTGTESNN